MEQFEGRHDESSEVKDRRKILVVFSEVLVKVKELSEADKKLERVDCHADSVSSMR